MRPALPATHTDMISPLFYATNLLESLGNRYIFNPVGLTATSFKILSALKKRRETPSAILFQVGGLKSNLSQRLRALETKGLIRRFRRSRSDKRKIFFELTKNGKHLLQQAETYAKHARLSFEKEFTPAELKQHKAFFAKLLSLLTKKETSLQKHFCVKRK